MEKKMIVKTKRNQFDSLLFRKHVQRFCESHDLINFKSPQEKILLSVSGGVDSIVLLHIFLKLTPQCEVLHFNHGTRGSENLKEQDLILRLCNQNAIKCHLVQFQSLKLSQSNFEQEARKLRLREYRRFISIGYKILSAHHLNDSFEWSLMQSFKQSQLKTTLGIPVFSNGMIRPFLCVSKNQIIRYARQNKLTWFEDVSNQNVKFERNLFRISIESPIQNAYPQFLKHYVARSNELAFLLGKHRLNKISSVDQDCIYQDVFGGVCLEKAPSTSDKNIYKKWIYHFSQSTRGTIESELEKVCQSIEREQRLSQSFLFKGPIDFSGGAKVIFFYDHIYFFNLSIFLKWKEFDQSFCERLISQPNSQIPEVQFFETFPYFAILNQNSPLKRVKWAHPLLKVTIKWLKEQEIPYTFTRLLNKKHRQILIETGLRLDSSLDGL